MAKDLCSEGWNRKGRKAIVSHHEYRVCTGEGCREHSKQGLMNGNRRGNNDHMFATTWSYTANIWENIQNGLPENPQSEGLVVPGADRERIKGTHCFYLHSLIINRSVYYFQDLKTHPKEQINESSKVVSITGVSKYSRICNNFACRSISSYRSPNNDKQASFRSLTLEVCLPITLLPGGMMDQSSS